jgi:hypothetical protein
MGSVFIEKFALPEIASRLQGEAYCFSATLKKEELCSLISGRCCDVNEMCALLGWYAVYSGNSVLMFRDNLSRVK